jgi:hypothetical protein
VSFVGLGFFFTFNFSLIKIKLVSFSQKHNKISWEKSLIGTNNLLERAQQSQNEVSSSLLM